MPVPASIRGSMSSQLEATSAILGEFMLKGWTLTDLHCDTCRVTPLMREPAAQASEANRARVQFCALCDGSPDGQPPSTTAESIFQTPDVDSTSVLQFTSPLDPDPPVSARGSASSASASTSLRHAAPSAPPSRPVPITPQSTDNLRDFPAPPDHVPRSQIPKSSDEVAQLISSRLLQGYSLLQLNCPNPSCRGVPLIGFPRRPDGSKDSRRACVSCGQGYVSEQSVGAGGLTAVPHQYTARSSETSTGNRLGTGAAGSGSSRSDGPESPRSKARREMYETGEVMMQMRREVEAGTNTTGTATAVAKGDILDSADDEMDGMLDGRPRENVEKENDTLEPTSLDLRPLTDTSPQTASNPVSPALSRANNSLSTTLDRLSASLARHTLDNGDDAGTAARYFVDVKLHTEAMRDVLEVLERVSRIQGTRR